MGIFDRIRKIFSRSESSSTNRGARFINGHSNHVATEFNHVVQRSYQVEHNRHFNVSTSRPRSSNVIDRSSATALHRSNTTSITAQASSTSHRQPDANFKRANSCKGLTLPLLGNAVYSAEYVKASNTAANVSELPRSKGSHRGSHEVNVKDDSKISNAINYRREYPRPSDSKAASAEYSTTSIGESKRKVSDLNIMQSTPKAKPECRKPTSNQNTLSSVGDIDNVNYPSDFWRTTKRISTESGNTEQRSTVEKDRNYTSKDPMPITSKAKTAHSMSCNTPAISPQGAMLNKNHTIQTLSNTTASAFDCSFTPHKIERKLSDHNRGVGGSGNPQQQSTSLSKTGTSSISKASAFDCSFTPHKIERKLSDYNRGVGGSSNPQQQSTSFSKTGTSSISKTSKTSAFLPSITLHKIESPKVSDHSRRIRETFGNSQQSATLNKTNTTQTSSNSKASVVVPTMTSYKRNSTTISNHRSVRMDDQVPVSMDTDYECTIPQLTRTYIGVDKVVEAPGASILKPQPQGVSTVFHSVKESSTASTLRTLNPSCEIASPLHALHTHFAPLPAQRFPPYTTRESQSKVYRDTKPQYSLRSFTSKLQTPPKDKSFKPENVIYHDQWTECSAQILNVDNEVNVSSNSPHVEFRDTKIKKGHLHFKMKCSATGNISILIKIDNFALTNDFDVTFNPCSSYLSDMTIEKINAAEDEFVFRVFIFDVFGVPVPSNSTANCQLDASFQNNVVRKVEHDTEQEQICYDITVRGERPWSQDLVVLLNGEQISHPREFEFTDKECNAINYIEHEDYEWIQQFFDEDDCGITISLITGDDDGKFVAYNENDCELQSQNAKTHKLVCKNVRKYDILGEDCAHINNIKRVLELKDRVEIQETDGCAIIALRNIKSHPHPICKEVVQHLLRGLYYRRKVSEAARVRMKWKNRLIGIDEVLWLDRKTPSFVFCKYFRDFFGDLMNKYNREACDELFKFFNFQRDESEVDLHGLLVADEKKLESLRLNLLIGSLGQKQIKKILEICRIKSKEGRERQTLRKKFRKGEVPESLVKIFIGGRKGGMDDKSLDDLEHECSDEDCSLCFENSFDDDEYYDDGDYDDDDCNDDDYDDGRGNCDWQSSRSSERSKFLQNESESSIRNDQRDDVDAIIRRCRLESDEAIRNLEEKLDKLNLNKTTWLEIVVGAGRHSRIKNEQNIRPKVEKLLKERNLKFAPVNKGSLVVTFKPYSGPEPCFGEYYCEKCDRCWKSSKSYVRKYQKCASCKANCWPVKQREKDKVTNYRRDGAGSVKRQSKPHQSSLCQKCQELGRPCNEDDYYDSDSDY